MLNTNKTPWLERPPETAESQPFIYLCWCLTGEEDVLSLPRTCLVFFFPLASKLCLPTLCKILYNDLLNWQETKAVWSVFKKQCHLSGIHSGDTVLEYPETCFCIKLFQEGIFEFQF